MNETSVQSENTIRFVSAVNSPSFIPSGSVIVPLSRPYYVTPPYQPRVALAPPRRMYRKRRHRRHDVFRSLYHQFAGAMEYDMPALVDHCYARPLNWTPEKTFYKPTKTLFVPKLGAVRRSANPLAPLQDPADDFIDVESIPEPASPLYDVAAVAQLMEECRSCPATRNEENDDWEETMPRYMWTVTHNRLFNGMADILKNEVLAQLANTDRHYEAVLRRVATDKSVKRARRLFASVLWDPKLTQWLHQMLTTTLPSNLLSCYLDILQTLKCKLPSFVEKILLGSNLSVRGSNELLKRSWDPFTAYLQQNKPKKLPGNPVFVVIPSAPNVHPNSGRRQHKWANLLSHLATVSVASTNLGGASHRLTMTNCTEQMLAAARARIQEVQAEYSGRPIILVGFNAGASVALQAAQLERVFAVVCLGFSALTAEGKRGEPDDCILELQCPVLFVIGQCSNTSLQEDVEDMRERMRTESGLIVVGSADDYLRVNKKTKCTEGITQGAVDRFIVEHVGEFLNDLLVSPYPPQVRQSPVTSTVDTLNGKRTYKPERVRKISNCSSVDSSEPPSPSPTPRRPGRPPGTKNKAKLAAAQGIVPSSPPPSNLSHKSYTMPNLSDSNHDYSIPISEVVLTTDTDTTNSSDTTLASATNNSTDSQPTTPAAVDRMQFGGSGPASSSTLSQLLQQGGYRGVHSQPKLTVLQNLKLSDVGPGGVFKLQPPNSRHSLFTSKPQPIRGSNVVIMPDGKMRSMGPNTPPLQPLQRKLITSRQARRPFIPSHYQRPPPPPEHQSLPSQLPPPTSLDIMDLPIIFADDNQVLTDDYTVQKTANEIKHGVPAPARPPSTPALPPPTPSPTISNPVGKLVILNKQPINVSIPSQHSTPTLRRQLQPPVPKTSNPSQAAPAPQKYTKIIISRPSVSDSLSSAEVTLKKIEPSTSVMDDMDEAIVATAISKPKYVLSSNKAEQDETGGDRPIILNSMALNMKRKSFKVELEDDGRESKHHKSSTVKGLL